MPRFGFNIVVKRPVLFLGRLIDRLEEPAAMSLEGDVTFVDVRMFPGWTDEPTPVLPRNTIHSTARFLIIPIEATTKAHFVQSLLPRIGIRRRVYHVQIAQNDERIFAAYDSFHPECVWIDSWVGEVWLTHLVQEGILRTYAQSA